MIIMNQKQNMIVNYINIKLIGTDGNGTIRARLAKNDNVILGTYETEERAKEVLQEIIQCYKDENCVTGTAMYHEQLVYEMSKE